MNQRLIEIADIRTGYQFRGRVVEDEQGETDVIQIKDVNERRQVDLADLTSVSLENTDSHLVRPGDVLFLSRGHRMYGTSVPRLKRDTVVSSYFYVLRPNSSDVDPGYLAWFLNEPYFQHRLQSHVRGSHMPMISRRDFVDLKIVVPDMETQKQIVRLNELKNHEAELLDQLKAKRAELIKGVSRQLFTGSVKTKGK